MRDRSDDVDIDRLGQTRELLQRIGCRPGLARPLDGDQERVFGGAVGGEWDAWNGNLLELISDDDGLLIVPPTNDEVL
ncbi:MAG: hypothetical protein ACRDJC_01600 [Thermomicrobiales bacterium]